MTIEELKGKYADLCDKAADADAAGDEGAAVKLYAQARSTWRRIQEARRGEAT